MAEIPLTRFLALCHRDFKRDGIHYIVSSATPGSFALVGWTAGGP